MTGDHTGVVAPRAAPGPLSDAVRSFDAAVERRAVRLRGQKSVDAVMYSLSEAGTHSGLWHAINGIDAIGGVARGDAARWRTAGRRSAIQGIEQAIVNGPVKLLFRRERPSEVMQHPHSLRAPRTSSFPSGHSTAGFCAATLLSRQHGHAVVWYPLAAAVGWSRVHVGVHHPSDVLGGALIGIALAGLLDWALPGRAPH